MSAAYEEKYLVTKAKVKEILTVMNGLSEEGFNNRMMNDPYFRKGFDVLVQVFMQAKFDE